MTGVVTGMNEKGLTVSINASTLETPKMSATPVSLLAKKILQYSSNISEAVSNAESLKTFVCESFLVCSASDGRAVVIEKTPSETAVYDPAGKDADIDRIICTNHYQSDTFAGRQANVENLRDSDSGYRYRRVEELTDSLGKIDPESAALVLRDRRGDGGADIGMCNELSINQLLAMHSVIFRPCTREMWVSAGPWQCGRYQRFCLDDCLEPGLPVLEPDADIPADPFLSSAEYRNLAEFKKMELEIFDATSAGGEISQDYLNRFISLNPLYYNAYNIAGDYLRSAGDVNAACELWRKSLTFAMKPQERSAIEKKIERYKK